MVGREKGIDVRIAIDSIRLAHKREYDVALFISEDANLSEAVKEIKLIGSEQGRYITIASAFPQLVELRRGIPLTVPIPIDLRTYHTCIDPRRYG